jgi:hypothetical protein
MTEPHGLRLRNLPIGRGPAGEVLARSRNQLRAAWLTLEEDPFLLDDEPVELVVYIFLSGLNRWRNHA